MTGSILRTEDLCRNFFSGEETVRALRDVSLAVHPGTLTILRGRSGSGKTTLINLLGALDRPTHGKIFFQSQEIGKRPEHRRDEFRRRHVGFVFQCIALIALMSAYENVEFALRVAGHNPDTRRGRAEECLRYVGLQTRMHHRPHELSGGEQQRVAIARAICHKPTVVFADEPTAELDTHTGLQVVKLFRRLVENESLTVVMSTHDPSMVDIADHVYSLEDGAIVDAW